MQRAPPEPSIQELVRENRLQPVTIEISLYRACRREKDEKAIWNEGEGEGEEDDKMTEEKRMR